eukprot:jgi/Orpsp1_1/1174216/evm.model.c7180000049310.1
MEFGSDVSAVKLNELLFFNLEINDTYNAKVLGQSNSYCWDKSCIFPSAKRNPGTYLLRLNINTFGKYHIFEENYISIKIQIRECNNPYIYQNIDNSRFKSCYLPICKPSCNTGICVNNNVCNCTQTLFTGTHCGVDFLIIILIGSLFIILHTILHTYNKTKSVCYLTYLFNNIGFSLVFGSILVKTLRIYRIFCITEKMYMGLQKKTMYGIILLILFYHLFVNLSWVILDKVNVELKYTGDFKEYKSCSYPKSKIL